MNESIFLKRIDQSLNTLEPSMANEQLQMIELRFNNTQSSTKSIGQRVVVPTSVSSVCHGIPFVPQLVCIICRQSPVRSEEKRMCLAMRDRIEDLGLLRWTTSGPTGVDPRGSRKKRHTRRYKEFKTRARAEDAQLGRMKLTPCITEKADSARDVCFLKILKRSPAGYRISGTARMKFSRTTDRKRKGTV